MRTKFLKDAVKTRFLKDDVNTRFFEGGCENVSQNEA